MLVSNAAGKSRGVQSPRVKALLEGGTITREQSQRLDAFAIRLREMVQAGKLTRKEATDLWQSLLDDQDAKQKKKKGA